MATNFSLKEAAAIADIPEHEVRKAIEAKTVRPFVASAGRSPRYRFVTNDLLFLKLLIGFPFPLRREDKAALHDIVGARQRSAGRWRCGDGDIIIESDGIVLRLDVKPARNLLAHRLRAFHRGRRRVVSNPDVLGGEPVFAGTRIPLAHIARLFTKNVPFKEIQEDYPGLSPEDLEYAALVARIKPNPGRPRKPLVLVRSGCPVTTRDRVAISGS